ncbi:MAG TPA: DUF3644 domain-containing protein [Acidimicrobiales bacterium]|nr:DUF3644 domain-containing protein [Acidimicrobiales bacterium]
MKKETKVLKEKALNSLTLCVGHFNSTSDTGRVEAVLHFLDHSFEMLLKAAILHRGGKIRDRGEKNTIGFDACVRRALSDGQVQFLADEQALTLQAINGLRDAAQHHLVDISEGHLYLHAQAGITLFRDLLDDVFDDRLRDYLPDRILPISTIAPLDPIALFTEEIDEVARLLKPGTRRRMEAAARLRSLAIVDGALRGEKLQPSEANLRNLGKKVAQGNGLSDVFPGIAAVDFVTEGTGPTVSLRIAKKEGVPVHLVPEGAEDAGVVAVKRVNELDFYNLSHADLARHVGLTAPKTTAAVRYLDLASEPDCYREVTIGKSSFKRYSQKAIAAIQTAVDEVGIHEIWEACGTGKGRPSA